MIAVANVNTEEQRMARENCILRCQAGSHMYGTNTPESDTDEVGIFIPNKRYVLGLATCEQVEYKTNPSSSGLRNTKDDSDVTIYSLPKFVHLALGCNPNILEILFVGNYLSVPVAHFGAQLIINRRDFLSQRVRATFLGYAYSQRQKLLVKKDRLDAIRQAKEDLYLSKNEWDEYKSEFLPNTIAVKGSTATYHTFEKGTSIATVLAKLSEMEQEYGLRTKSIEQFGYDTKFAMHLIRLLHEGTELLSGKDLVFPLPEEIRSKLMEIRHGKWPISKILLEAESMMERAEKMDSPLPRTPDTKKVEEMLVEILSTFWRSQEKVIDKVLK